MSVDWLELSLDYRCNLRCIGCRACVDTGESLDGPTIVSLLRASASENVWIGGGEPTLRDDLLRIVATARQGRKRVLVQTNGMRLAYPAYVDALVAAGMTDVSLNVKSHRAEVHDALSGREGCHALLLCALENLRRTRVTVTADVLLTVSTAPDLPDTVRDFAARGVSRFVLWLLSSADVDDPRVKAEVPRIADLPLVEAARAADETGVELITMHTPPCTIAPSVRDRHVPARALRLLVVDPSGRSFPLEQSHFEGGVAHRACEACSARGRCHGPREDYLRLHGDREIAPI